MQQGADLIGDFGGDGPVRLGNVFLKDPLAAVGDFFDVVGPGANSSGGEGDVGGGELIGGDLESAQRQR